MRDEEIGYLRVINYELWMLVSCLGLDSGGLEGHRGAVLRNAIMESALIHTRVLCEVVLNGDSKKDIRLENFAKRTTWPAELRDAADELQEIYTSEMSVGLEGAYDQTLRRMNLTPRKALNAHLAHADVARGTAFSWTPVLFSTFPRILRVYRAFSEFIVGPPEVQPLKDEMAQHASVGDVLVSERKSPWIAEKDWPSALVYEARRFDPESDKS